MFNHPTADKLGMRTLTSRAACDAGPDARRAGDVEYVRLLHLMATISKRWVEASQLDALVDRRPRSKYTPAMVRLPEPLLWRWPGHWSLTKSSRVDILNPNRRIALACGAPLLTTSAIRPARGAVTGTPGGAGAG